MRKKRQFDTLRCDNCGRFIAYKEFEEGTAFRTLLTPDSPFTKETYSTEHLECYNKQDKNGYSIC